MPDRNSQDARIAELTRKLEEERMKTTLDREEALAAARMTHPAIRRKRRTLNFFIIGGAAIVLGVVLYFMFREPPRQERQADDDAWSLPPPEPLPDAPELPDLTKKTVKRRTGTVQKKERDLLGDIGEETSDPIGN